MPILSNMKQSAIDRMVEAGITMLAAYSGAQTFVQRVFEDPKAAHQTRLYQQRASAFDLLWAYYNNSLFDKTLNSINQTTVNIGNVYRQNYNLYRNIRMIYNPVRRLVDFYAGAIYPGVLSEDGACLPDSVPMAIPFSEDTDPELKDAIAQFWQWTNWQAKKTAQVRYGAALGSVLIELTDDLQRGKITADVVWPGFITFLQLDPAGNVKLYVMDYQGYDPVDGPYVYRKIVTQTEIRTYRNYEPYDYDGNGAVVENPYGFVPAVWIKHIDVGGDFGSPAIAGSIGKVDELNSLASHIHDQVHKAIGAPKVIWSNMALGSAFEKKDRNATQDFTPTQDDQQSMLILRGPENGRVDSLLGDLNLADALNALTMLQGEIEQDHPELAFYRELRSMSQVTGPAASRLVGDVSSRVMEAMANYDQGNISLFRMAVAMGGFRANNGDWGALNSQQQKFKPFNLDSYESGNLDMAIMPRPLLVPTRLEKSQEKQAMWTGVKMAVDAGATLEFVLRDEGYTDDELQELGESKVKQIQQDQLLANEDVVPTVQQ